MKESTLITTGIADLDSRSPRARLRGEKCGQRPHDHAKAGLRVRGLSGTQYQWCSDCGALGVYKDGGEALWIAPGLDAEDMVIDVMAALR